MFRCFGCCKTLLKTLSQLLPGLTAHTELAVSSLKKNLTGSHIGATVYLTEVRLRTPVEGAVW